MEATLNMMTDVGNKIEISAFNGITNLSPYMLGLLTILATIAIATEWDMFFSNMWNWGNLITKFLHIGMIAFLIRNWANLLTMVKQFAEKLGMIAGGSDIAYTPSQLLASTLNDIYSTFEILLGKFSFMNHPLTYIMIAVALLVAMFAVFRIAFVLFMANAEFLILGSLAIVLLPFGITKWTSSISDKTWGIILTSCVKLMVAIFMICLVGNEIHTAFNVNTSADFTDKKNVATFLTSSFALLFISFLCAQAVDFAGAMTTGVMINSNNIIHSVPAAASTVRSGAGMVMTAAKTPYRVATTPFKIARATKNYGVKAGRIARHPLRSLRGWWNR